MKLVSRDTSADLAKVLSCRATMFQCLGHNLQQVPMMWHHNLDLLLFRTIAGTGDLLSNHALGIFQICFPSFYIITLW